VIISLLLLLEESVSLVDLEDKNIVRAHVLSDLVKWQVDQHTGDLWSLSWSNHIGDELVNSVTNLVLH